MCARRTATDAEELRGTKDENEHRQLLDAARLSQQPRVVLSRAVSQCGRTTDSSAPSNYGITEYVCPRQQEPVHLHIKKEDDDKDVPKEETKQQSLSIKKEEESEHACMKEERKDPPYIKEEPEEKDVAMLPSTGVPLKNEAGASEASRWAEPPTSSSCQQMTTEGDGDHCGVSQADVLLAPLSESDNAMSHALQDEEEAKSDISEYICPEQQEPEHLYIKKEDGGKEDAKEEEEQLSPSIKKEEEPDHACVKEEGKDPPFIKEEQEEKDVDMLPSTAVPLKSEDGATEASRGVEPPTSSSCQQMTTEGDGDHCGGSQADGLLAPLSESDDAMSDALQDEEEAESDRECHTDKKCWKCSLCRKTFARKEYLKKHMKIHTGDKPFGCTGCGKRFSWKVNLKQHTRTHTGEKPYACSVCRQRFSHMANLKLHTRTHTGEKPCACSVCGQRFSNKGNLKKHTRTHTGERPYACSVCGQRFSYKGNLKQHTRTHTGEKPYACSVCGQGFSQRGSLIKHIRTHTGEKPYACSVCGQKFSTKDNLKKHTRTHTGEKPYACSVCGKRFTYKCRVKRHKCAGEERRNQEASNENVNGSDLWSISQSRFSENPESVNPERKKKL
ncbi:uncharacterized protein LOC144004475 isoform X1 [Festucalex cinctus]